MLSLYRDDRRGMERKHRSAFRFRVFRQRDVPVPGSGTGRGGERAKRILRARRVGDVIGVRQRKTRSGNTTFAVHATPSWRPRPRLAEILPLDFPSGDAPSSSFKILHSISRRSPSPPPPPHTGPNDRNRSQEEAYGEDQQPQHCGRVPGGDPEEEA